MLMGATSGPRLDRLAGADAPEVETEGPLEENAPGKCRAPID